MTDEEVIKFLEGCKFHCDNEESINRATYALEKQIPKKPTKKPTVRKGCSWIYRCPSCTYLLYWTDEPKNHGTKDQYCTRCGQRIDWGEGDEE